MTGWLLDTCTFLWLIGLPERLPVRVRESIAGGDTDAYVSTATLWEVLIKHGKGQIGLVTGSASALEFLTGQCVAHELATLPIGPDTLAALEHLPPLHTDPFDRLLICQAIEHGLTLVTPDADIRRYPIKTFW